MAKLIGGVSRIIHFVKDVRAITAWYQKIFQLEPIGDITAEWAELKVGPAGGCNLAFHKCPGEIGAGESFAKFCFATSDVPAAKKLLESRGATLGPVKTFGDLTLCDGKDPAGNRFQLSNRGV